MPLMIFAIAIAAAEIVAARWRAAIDTKKAKGSWLGRAVPIALALLYLASLLIRAMKTDEAAASPISTSIVEMFGRISAGAPLFTHYFPAVEPHYGFTGIGVVAAHRGQPVYETSVVVFRYFAHANEGSAALGAILDFYCAFGSRSGQTFSTKRRIVANRAVWRTC
jgi:hypothetical protein